uniref:Uncharacterized protein n=1 Tax=Rhipicephalus appendiculatus TaxID=34631 RepID=A0A131YEC6_RHIAP
MSSPAAWAIILMVTAGGLCSALASYSASRDQCVKCACKYAEERHCEWNYETNCYCVHGCYREGLHGRLLTIRECFPILHDYN